MEQDDVMRLKEYNTLALDVSKNRIGMAFRHKKDNMIYTLPVWYRTTLQQDIFQVSTVVNKWEIKSIVLLFPLDLKGNSTNNTVIVKNFHQDIMYLNIPIISVDERYTTQEVKRRIQNASPKLQKITNLDSIVAANVLESLYSYNLKLTK